MAGARVRATGMGVTGRQDIRVAGVGGRRDGEEGIESVSRLFFCSLSMATTKSVFFSS